MKTVVMIPTYNEKENIGPLINDILSRNEEVEILGRIVARCSQPLAEAIDVLLDLGVVEAEDGNQAMDLYRSGNFDLVVTDWKAWRS